MAESSYFEPYTSHSRLGRRPVVQNEANSSIADCGLPGRHRATGVRLRQSCRIAD